MKFVWIFILLWLTLFSSVHAWVEEWICFELLNEAVSNDTRFRDNVVLPNDDLTSVLLDEVNNSFVDLSNYTEFRNNRVTNPVNSWGSPNDDYLFEARRNNIGTIIAGNDYVYSQVTGFWRESNFDFPLSAPWGSPSFGDKYVLSNNFFKEYITYTHHVKSFAESYPLMSCGIVKVTPLDGRTFAEINEWWYMTNILTWISNQPNLWNQKCNSGFEGTYKSRGWEDFYQMKSNVCVVDYALTDYLKLEVISIAYDNDSTRINEYYTHPLQVEAMTNNANHADGLKGIQDIFMQKLVDETCYRVIHWNGIWNLPPHCSGAYGPLSYTPENFSFLNLFIPSTFAKLDIEGLPGEGDEEIQSWMMVQGNLPYKLYQKLQEIPDENFRDYMLLSILPNFDKSIEYKAENNVLLTPFEEVFLACNIDYSERLSIVQKFLEDVDVEDFSLSNLQYTNDRYGDCIIPYPDADKISSVVEDSFESNKLLAQQLSGEYNGPEVSDEVNNYIQERQALLDSLNDQLVDIESQFNRGEISLEESSERKLQEEEKINTQIDQLTSDFQDSAGIEELIEDNVSDREEKTDSRSIILLILLSLVWVFLVWFVVYKNKKK